MSTNILFLVTGMTPQVITETLWALSCDPDNESPWVPDEIHVISTEHGLNQIRSRLFQSGIFEQMQAEYPVLAQVCFDEGHLIGINDTEGNALFDLRTPEDNEFAAEAICQKVREFTQQEDTCLHVSIAGGRKTMGFYAGYALSLYGRAQDRMSHVLVDDRYELAKNFYYPSTNPKDFAVTKDDQVIGPSCNARIWLADIPFVRMRYGAISKEHQLNSDDSFSQVVAKINESFSDVRLALYPATRGVNINNKFEFILSPRAFALYYLFARRRKNGQPGVVAPTKEMTVRDLSVEEIDRIRLLSVEFNQIYGLYKDEPETDLGKKAFADIKRQLKAELEKNLGMEMADKVGIVGGRREPFYLGLPVEQISLHG